MACNVIIPDLSHVDKFWGALCRDINAVFKQCILVLDKSEEATAGGKCKAVELARKRSKSQIENQLREAPIPVDDCVKMYEEGALEPRSRPDEGALMRR
eukprot:IDg11608t1